MLSHILPTLSALVDRIEPTQLDNSTPCFARGALTSAMRDGDSFKEATTAPQDASQIERLVAFSGRSL